MNQNLKTQQANFSKTLLSNRMSDDDSNESDLFLRIAEALSENYEHKCRLYEYMNNHWFLPATPILANIGTKRGLPISCFVNEIEDDLSSIIDNISEMSWCTACGGGIGTFIGNLRHIGEKINNKGITPGIIPFVKMIEQTVSSIAQGRVRRGACAVYLNVNHPEIETFINIRKPSGGDPDRKALNIHHGIVLNDLFINKVKNNEDLELISPLTNMVIKTVNARNLWINILITRLETGEPYLLFIDTINRMRPDILKKLNIKITTSNLCSEIVLPTGPDPFGSSRTAVCCLSSVNLEKFDEWKNHPTFIYDIMLMLDNVLNIFQRDASKKYLSKAIYSSLRERSVGLGVMGFHTYLQSKMIPFNSEEAKKINLEIFSKIKKEADKSSYEIALKYGSCLDAKHFNITERFLHKIAVAPTANISSIFSVSPGIEPIISNAFIHKTGQGSFNYKNQHLSLCLDKYSKNNDEIWTSIAENLGSVQHLHFLSSHDKEVFKTAFEIPQESLITLAHERAKYICQAQSLNLFMHPNVSKKYLHDVHMLAANSDIKSLYYLRSLSIQRAKYSSCNSCE